MKMSARIYTAAFALLFLAANAFSQTPSDSVTITGGYVPELRAVEKIATRPEVVDTFSKKLKPTYDIQPKIVDFYYIPDTLSAARMKTEPLKKLRRFYVKLGFGNYLSPLAEVRMNSLRSKQFQYDVYYKYFASYGKKLFFGKNKPQYGYPGIQDHGGGANFSYMLKTHTLGVHAGYQSNQTHFYGYDASQPGLDTIGKKDIRQNYQKIDIALSFKNNRLWDSTKLITDNYIRYYYLFDRYKASEHGLDIRSDWRKMVAGFFVGGALGVEYYAYRADTATGRSFRGGLVHIDPYIRAGKRIWEVQAGLNIAFGFDTLTKFYIAPNIRARLNAWKEHVVVYADLTGGAYRNTFDALRRGNPFIVSHVPVRNAYKPIDLVGGIRGKFAKNFYYNLGGGYEKVFNKAFYMTDTTRALGNYFTVAYDDLGTGKLFAELGYERGEVLRVGMRVNAYFLDPGNFAKAWYMPQYDATLSAMYNLRDKFIFRVDLFYLGDQFAPKYTLDPSTMVRNLEVVRLRNAIDLNIGAEYRYNKLLSFFVQGNNLAGFRYNRWLQYPTQGVSVLGGITLSF